MTNLELAQAAQKDLQAFEAKLQDGLRRAVGAGDHAAAGKVGAMIHEVDAMHRKLNRIGAEIPEIAPMFGGDGKG